MIWKTDTLFPSLVTHLPHSLHDLITHEDATLIADTETKLIAPPTRRPPDATTGGIDIARLADPELNRNMQNMQLLVADWLHNLPYFDPDHAPTKRLVEHWQQVIRSQPERLASAQSFWGNEKTRRFWQEMLARQQGGEQGLDVTFDDWQKSAGTHTIPHPLHLDRSTEKQWQDLVLRTRLHYMSLRGYGRDR